MAYIIQIDEYREARKVLQAGSAPVVAHALGWLSDEWQRIVEVRANRGMWLARFFAAPEKWTQIDGLKIRK